MFQTRSASTNRFEFFQLYFFSLNQLTTVFGGICGLYAMFKSDGTIDKIFTGGAGKNGATVAVSDATFSSVFLCMILFLPILHVFVTFPFCDA